MANQLRVTLVRSPIGCKPKHKLTLEGLGLRKLNRSVVIPADDACRVGMVKQINYLLKVEEV